MQSISNIPAAALPLQRTPELANLSQDQFDQSGSNTSGQDIAADLDNQADGGNAGSRQLQSAEIQSADRVPAAAARTSTDSARDQNPAATDGQSTVLQQARTILEQFDVGSMTADELQELRSSLEQLGVGRGQNLVDLQV